MYRREIFSREKMMKDTHIGICDDELFVCQMMRKMIIRYCSRRGLSCDVSMYTDAVTLLKGISGLSIVFLDIDMPEMDGIEAGQRIARYNPSCKVVMATGHQERFKDAFKIGAMRCITKPFDEDEIEEALDACLKERPGEEEVEAYKDRIPHRIKQREIFYLRAYNGYVEIHTAGEVFRSNSNLSEMEKALDHRMFFRTHRSFTVNLSRVEHMGTKTVAVGEFTVPVGRRNMAAFKQALLTYEREYGG